MYDWVKSDLQNFGQYYSGDNEVRDLSNEDIDIAFLILLKLKTAYY